MIEVNQNGDVLATFTDVNLPTYLSTDIEGHVTVADRRNHRILLLNSKLHLEHVLVSTNSQVELWEPARVLYNEVASQLYVLHFSNKDWQSGAFWLWSEPASIPWPDTISKFSLYDE